MSSDDEFDARQIEAYEKSVQAERLAAEGQLDEARELMVAAARLDLTYAVRAEFLGHSDQRKVEVAKTIRRTLVPFLLTAGFGVRGGGSWSEGSFLERKHARGRVDAVLIGRNKFGHRLGVLGARQRPLGVEYFDWRTAGLRSGTLVYTTQHEVEIVCHLWRQLITEHLFPWWEDV
jgi:hypothetical protein